MSAETSAPLRISRVFPCDRETVFRAWTEPEQLRRWSCPPAATIADAQVDLVVGGRFRLVMDGPAGARYTAFGTYREIAPPERLVYTWDWEEPEQAMGETVVTVEFRDLGGSTEIVLTHEGFPNEDAAAGHSQGWGLCLDQLAELLA
jgi:uncharacterized protein YndB with AHSA1/START domain